MQYWYSLDWNLSIIMLNLGMKNGEELNVCKNWRWKAILLYQNDFIVWEIHPYFLVYFLWYGCSEWGYLVGKPIKIW